MKELIIKPKNDSDKQAIEALARRLGAEVEEWDEDKEDSSLFLMMEKSRNQGRIWDLLPQEEQEEILAAEREALLYPERLIPHEEMKRRIF